MPQKKLSEHVAAQYTTHAALSDRLIACLSQQFDAILQRDGISLGVPIESRVKSLSSIRDKVEHRGLSISNIEELDDVAGLRLILLFQKDLESLDKALRSTFVVLRYEDTANRLGEAQFGYQSYHYVIGMPKDWGSVPSFAPFSHMRAEIQVRTLAQHIWAAASHKLQYKHEDSVPGPLKRSINRVSALLETIDLEFTRLLSERDAYVSAQPEMAADSDKLNVENLAKTLANIFPASNLDEDEDYDKLLRELRKLKLQTVGAVRTRLEGGLQKALLAEEYEVSRRQTGEFDTDEEDEYERLQRGVFFTHCGLARNAIPGTLKFAEDDT